MKHTIATTSPASDAAGSYFRLPPYMRRHAVFRSVVEQMRDSGEPLCVRSLFRDPDWLYEWMLPDGRYCENTMRKRRKVMAEVLGTSPWCRDIVMEEISRLSAGEMHPADMKRLVCLGRELAGTDSRFWASRLWRILGDSFCLYATLDARLVARELDAHAGLSASGSYQLLRGNRACREIYFRIGFPYYALRRTDWAPFAEILRRDPWAWDHVLMLSMNRSLLVGMLTYLHRLPPAVRPPAAERFLSDNRDALAGILGEESFLIGSPDDYRGMADSDVCLMSETAYFESGAVMWHPSRLQDMQCRIGIAVGCRGTRVRVLCSDSREVEERRMFLDLIRPGEPVVLWQRGAVALRDLSGCPLLLDVLAELDPACVL